MAAVIPHASEAANTGLSWRRMGVLAAISIGIPLLYWPAAESLAALWQDAGRTTYTHGYAILAVSCYLMWRRREDFSHGVPEGDTRFAPLWIGLLAVCALAWHLAYRAGVSIGIELLLPGIVWCTIGAIMGTRAAVIALVPLGYLGFAFTFWDVVNPALQWATVHAVRVLLQVIGVPTYFEGDIVHIPSGTFEIEGGCSGLHFLIVGLAIATLMGELRGDDWRRRATWLLLALALALLVNWVRVAAIIYAGHVTSMQHYLVRVSHSGFGWVLFTVMLFGLYLIERRVALTPKVAPRDTALRDARIPGWVAVATIILAATPMLLNAILQARLAPLPAAARADARGAWGAAEPDLERWAPRQVNADREGRVAFTRDGARVETYVADYREQRAGKELGGYAGRPQGDAQVLGRTAVSAGGRHFVELALESGERRALLWVRYEVGERGFSDPDRAQIWYSLSTLMSLHSPLSRVIAFWSPCDPDCGTAREAIREFVDEGGLQ
jgi:exosortase